MAFTVAVMSSAPRMELIMAALHDFREFLFTDTADSNNGKGNGRNDFPEGTEA